MARDYFQDALCKFNIGISQWYGWKDLNAPMNYSNIKLNKNNAIMPTEAEVNAKIAELKQEETDKVTAKANAKQKLIDLGLTEEEVKALIGI